MSPGETKREVVLDPQESPGEIKSREVAGLRKLDCPFLQLWLNSCATDIVFVILLGTAVQTVVSGVH